MSLRAGTAYVDIVPRAGKDFDAALSKDLEPGAAKAGSTIGSTIGKAAGVLGGALVASKGIELLKGAVDAASDLNEATNVTGLIFKDARGEIDTFVKSSANIGLSEAKARELTGSIGGLLSNMGLAQGETVEWTKKLTTLGADMGSAFNAEPSEAIEAIGAALRGEAEPIRRFNVVLSDNAMKAEAMRLGLVKAAVDETKVGNARVGVEKATAKHAETLKKYGENSLEARDSAAKLAAANDALDKSLAGSNVELTQTQKTQATLSLITKQTAAVQGDFANTSDGLANKQRILAARLENVKARIGTGLLPIVNKVANVFAAALPVAIDLGGKAFNRLHAFIQPALDLFESFKNALTTGDNFGFKSNEGILGFVINLGETIGDVVRTITQAKGDIGSGLVIDLAGFFGLQEDDPRLEAFFGAVEKIEDVLGVVVSTIKDNVKPILAGLAGVILAIVVPAFVSWAVATIAAVFPFVAVAAAVVGLLYLFKRFPIIGETIRKVVDVAKNLFGELVSYVQTIWPQVSEAIGHVLAVVQGIVDFFVSFFIGAWHVWGDDLGRIVGAAFGFVKDTIDNVLQLIRGIIGFVLAVINGDWGKAWDALKQIAAAIWDEITGVIRFAFGVLEGLFGGLADTLGRAWSVVWDGIKGAARAAWEWIAENVLNPMIEGFNTAIRGLNILNPLKDIPYIPKITVGEAPGAGGGKTGPRAMALGGPLEPYRDYIVGEAGRPELVRMGASGGTVLTNASALSGSRAGISIEKLEVNGQPQPEQTARETVRELRRLAYLTGRA